ncbi:MAG: F-box protein, partial [Acidobacteriaceae bacterium]|nr:F-box protein [Acidobacteriaceae bacterium]
MKNKLRPEREISVNGDFNDSGRGAPEDERFRPFDNLPNELIEHIFRFGTAPDIVSWRTVSGRWNGLANDSVPGRVIRFQVAMGFLGTVIDSETRQLLEDIFREKGIHAYP